MKLLLDTHIWIWWINQNPVLPSALSHLIQEAEMVTVSSISCWEVRMLHQRQRVELSCTVDDWLEKALQPAGINCLAIDCKIAERSARLGQHHRDPADRLIIATALEHDCTLLSIDDKFGLYQEIKGKLISS